MTMKPADEVDAGLHLFSEAEVHARTEAFRETLSQLAPAPFVVTCFSAPLDLIAATRAVLLAGADAEPWQYTPNGPDWRDMARRSRRLRPMPHPPALLVSPEMRAAFSADDLQFFGEIRVALPDGHRGAALPDADRTPDPERLLFVETAGTTADPRCVALSCAALENRAALSPAAAPGGPVLRVLPVPTAEACSQILRPDASALWLDHSVAADRPETILAAAARHGASTLKLTPGHLSRLLAALPRPGALPDLSCVRLIELSGGPVDWVEAEALARALAGPVAPAPALRAVYRTLEAGAIRLAEAPARDGLPRDGRHCLFPDVAGRAEIRVVDPEFRTLPGGTDGEIQVRNDGCLAQAYRNPNGRRTPLLDGSGWLKTGDRGVLTPEGLIVSSATGSTLTVPRRVHSLAEIEARLRRVQGVRPETLAVLPPVGSDAGEEGALDVFFDSRRPGPAEVGRLASDIFTAIVALTGVQPNVYRVRPDQMPLTAGLAPRRAHLARLVRNGVLRAVAAPALQRRSPEEIARHERVAMIAEIWQDVLGLDAAPAEEADFFMLGADSLNLTTMLDQVEARFGQAVDIEEFFAVPTVGGLAACVADRAAAAPIGTPEAEDGGDTVARLARFTAVWRGERPFADSLIRTANPGGSRPPLFWILQSEQSFLDLAAALGPDQPFHALRSAVGVVEHYTVGALESISNRYLWEILALSRGRPFYLGGNCQGAIVALTLARRLRQIGQQPRRLVMMEWFFDFGGYEGPTTFLTGSDSFVAELQLTVPSLQRLSELFPDSTAHDIPGSHGQFFRAHIIGGVAEGIRRALTPEGASAPGR